MFGENGFLVGPEAFSSISELRKTILHELYRLRLSNMKDGVTRALVTRETKAAAEFADRAESALTD